jgi:hypothetical protein
MLRFQEAKAAGQNGEYEKFLADFSGGQARTIRAMLDHVPSIDRDRGQRLDERGAVDGVIALMSGEQRSLVDYAITEIRALPWREAPELIGMPLEEHRTAGDMLDRILHSAGETYWNDWKGRPFFLGVRFIRKRGRYLLEVVVQDGPSQQLVQFGDYSDGTGYTETREIRGFDFWMGLARVLYRRPRERAVAEDLKIPAYGSRRT